MNRLVIIEDEAVAARRLEKMVSELGFDIIKSFDSVEGLKRFVESEEETDLFLMDIHLSDGIVFEYLQEIKLETPIIFTTAFDQYAIRAFKQNSIDYLLKPINKEELKQAIDKYRNLQRRQYKIDLSALEHLVKSTSEYKSRIRVQIGLHFKSITVDEISLFYSDNKISFLRTKAGRSYPIEESLTDTFSKLDPSLFFQVNRAQIVHIDAIVDVLRFSGSRLKVSLAGVEDQEIIVARERVADFKDWLG